MRRIGAAAALALGAGVAWAQVEEVDIAGLWSCSISEYGSGEAPPADLFNLSIGRSGDFALAGRKPDGTVYQGNGTWRFGRAAGGVTVILEGITKAPGEIAASFRAEGDLVSEDEISRVTRRYGRTRAFDCVRQD